MTAVRFLEGPMKDEVIDVDIEQVTADYPRKYEPVPLDYLNTAGGRYWLHPGGTDPRIATWSTG